MHELHLAGKLVEPGSPHRHGANAGIHFPRIWANHVSGLVQRANFFDL